MHLICNLWLCRTILSSLSSIGWGDFSVFAASGRPPSGGSIGDFGSEKVVWSHNAWTSHDPQYNSGSGGSSSPQTSERKITDFVSPLKGGPYRDAIGTKEANIRQNLILTFHRSCAGVNIPADCLDPTRSRLDARLASECY